MLLIALLACRNKGVPEDTGPFLLDVDEDGFFEDVDCDDRDATVNPDATEACNGIDDNCDGSVDEGVLTTWFSDADGDTFGDASVPIEACERPPASSADDTDCDDGNSEVYPDAGERCNDVDDDCDGDIDEEVQTTWYADEDGDLHGDATASIDDCDPPEGYASIGDDCDDTDATSFPGASEVCDGADNNCDGDTDEDLLVTF